MVSSKIATSAGGHFFPTLWILEGLAIVIRLFKNQGSYVALAPLSSFVRHSLYIDLTFRPMHPTKT